MGETKVSIASKIDVQLAARLDELVEQWSPYFEGRSSLIRFLLEVACSGIDSGKIPDSLDSLQEYLREPCRPQIVRGK